MAVTRGFPRGGGGGTGGSGGGSGGSSGGGSGGSSGGGSTEITIDTTGIETGLAEISAALNTSSVPKEVMTDLYLYTSEGLVVLASDYKAYFNLTAYSGSILKVAYSANAILKIYGDLTFDNSAYFYMDNVSSITIGGE